MSTATLLTHDEHKASEAAFHGLPLDPKWSSHAQEIYLGILAVTQGRDIVSDTQVGALAIGCDSEIPSPGSKKSRLSPRDGSDFNPAPSFDVVDG